MNRNLKLILVLGVALVLVAGLVGAKSSKYSRGGWLGIYMQTVDEDIAEAFGLEVDHGVIVNGVVEDSPAEEAGLKEEDIIVSFAGEKIWESDDISDALEDYGEGDKVELVIIRDGDKMTLNVTLEDDDGDRDYEWVYRTLGSHGAIDIISGIKPPKAPKALRAPRAPRVIEYREHRGYMGVSISGLSKQLGEYFGVEKGRGALITEVVEDSPAMEAGLKAGDVIVNIEGERITDPGDVTDIMEDFEEGDEIEVTVMRDKSEKNIKLEVGEYDHDDHGLFRFYGDHDFDFNFDFESLRGLQGLRWLHDVDDDADYYFDAKNKYFDSKDFKNDLRKEIQELEKELQSLKKSEFKELQKEMEKLKKELKEIRLKLD